MLWVGLLLPTYWWVSAGGVQDLGGWESGLDSAGRLTGLWASVLLLAQVLLMARVPVLENAFGRDELVRIHRLVGFTSFNLMLVHIATITLGYAGGSLARTPVTAWDLTLDYPGMLLAVAGTAALVMVVVTSVKAARRRLRYESWHLIHLYGYLGAGLALPHQLWTGTDFTSSPGRTAFWWTAWGVVAASVLVWRLLLPALTSTRLRLRVTSVVDEAPGVFSIYLAGRRLSAARIESGQFFSWRFLGAPMPSRAHPFSLSAAPDGRSLRITVQAVGDDSTALRNVAPGSRVIAEGPYGRLSARARTSQRVLLLGAGVGIAPLRALAESLPARAGEIAVAYRYSETALFAAEFDQLSRERGLQLLPLTGHRRRPDSWVGTHLGPWPGGHPAAVIPDRLSDVDVLRSQLPDLFDRDVFVCGPQVWAEAVRNDLLAAGLPPARLHIEAFGW